jgi:predicted MFS family arabinose efflux permease
VGCTCLGPTGTATARSARSEDPAAPQQDSAPRQLVARDPLLPRALFTAPRILLSCATSCCSGGALYGTFVTNALHLSTDRGYPPLLAAAAMVPLDLALLAGSRLGGRLLAARHPITVLAAGLLVLAAGLAWLAAAADPRANLATSFLLPGIVAFAGMGAAIVGAFVFFTGAVSGTVAGAASGLTMTTNQVGGAIGIAGTVTLLAGGSGTSGALSLTAAFAAAAALIALALHRME